MAEHGTILVTGATGNVGRHVVNQLLSIAAVTVRVLLGEGHGGSTYHLTGPQVLTQIDQVHAIGEAIGRPLRFEEISPEDARRRMVTAGWPPAIVDGLLNAYARMVREPVPPTATVAELTGAPPRSFREWASDHADEFRQSSA